ncbi:MAG: outer membrane beta-barrel protein [Sphingobacteriaceae bacterium]|nr:outer membrane beta-barrel protein [Sphingobacteriaceae bacterium]
MKKLLLSIFLLLSTNAIFAQNIRDVSGTVRDSAGTGLIYATIRLTSPKDTLMTRSDVDGLFKFNGVKSAQFVLSISSLGYTDLVKRFLYSEATNQIKIDPIILKSQSNVLKEVIISGTPAVTVKQDTVEYRASDFPVRENSVAEDVIKKLPGVEVDKDGNVTTQGKSVTRIKVNGKDYFDGDLKTATQGLPADIIEKIQIVDDYGDQANITGIREGEADKIINITIRPDRMKGSVISGVVGGGNEDRYQVSGNGQFMNNDQQLDVRLNLNNTNSSPFNFGGGGGRGFGGGGGGNRGGGGGGGFGGGGFGGGGFGGGGFGGNNGGITTTTAGGINYRDNFSPKLAVNGSYRFNVRNTLSISNNERTSFFTQDSVLRALSTADTESGNNNHSANFNLEYAIDSLNYLRITPYFTIGSSDSDGFTDLKQQQTGRTPEDQQTDLLSNSSSPSYGGNLIYNHRFRKMGRNFSFGLNLSQSVTDNDQDVNDVFRYYNTDLSFRGDSISHRQIETSNNRFSANANITYSEPIGKLGRMDFGYNYNLSDYDNSRITNLYQGEVPVINNDLSNIYDYSFTTNRFSLNYRYDRPRLYNFTVGLTAQPTLLKGYSVTSKQSSERKGFNFFPTARFEYSFARTRSLSINYNGRSNEPSFNQIQPVIDASNPLRPVVGNPGLNSSFTQSLNLRYNSNNQAKGLFFNIGVFGNFTNNQITRNIVGYVDSVIVKGKKVARSIQETRFLNADNYYSTNSFYSISKSFLERKYRVSLNGRMGYTNDVSFTNGRENIGKNWTFSQNLGLQINPNPNVEIYPSVGYRGTNVDYTFGRDTRANTINYDLNGKLYFFKTFILGWDLSKNINKGYSSIEANPLIVNAYFEKQFFNRRGTLRFQGFDLLNEGTIVGVSQDANTITNSQTNRLTRYFMATFSFRIQKFPGGIQPNFDRNRSEGRGGDSQPRGDRGNF